MGETRGVICLFDVESAFHQDAFKNTNRRHDSIHMGVGFVCLISSTLGAIAPTILYADIGALLMRGRDFGP